MTPAPASALPAPGILITGMPGAGKSTVGALLAERLPRSAFLSGDAVNAMVRQGRVWALGEPREEARRQVRLMHRNLGLLAGSFAADGFVPVMDAVVPDREHLDEIADMLGGEPVLIVLAPGIRSCRARNAMRDEDERWEFEGYEALEHSMRDGFADRGLWLDTSALTAQETVERILARGMPLSHGARPWRG